MDGKTLARLGALAFVAIAVAAAAIEINRPDDGQEGFAAPNPPMPKQDPLDAELARCSQLGEAGPRDPSCLKAWSENRRRFLLQSSPETSSVWSSPATLFPDAPASVNQSGSAPSVPALQGGR
mgnify:CR=1 FL=1